VDKIYLFPKVRIKKFSKNRLLIPFNYGTFDIYLCILGISQTVLKSPEQSDPYEKKIVEVKQSLIPGAGQGLFAKKSVEKGVILAYFAGVAVSDTACSGSEYSISWLHGYGLDIPENLRQSYCSTLGHKACHSFAPNCEYSWAFHPRFGKIRAILSLRQIEAGEEILTDYKYSYNKAPQWYKEDLSRFLVTNFNMSLEEINDYIDKMEKSKKDHQFSRDL